MTLACHSRKKLQFIRDALPNMYSGCNNMHGNERMNFYSYQRYKNTKTLSLIGIGIRLIAGLSGQSHI